MVNGIWSIVNEISFFDMMYKTKIHIFISIELKVYINRYVCESY